MSWSASNSQKCCANCTNWAGERTEEFGRARIPSPSTRGKCYANVPCGVTQGPNATSGSSCSKFQKWAALK